MLIGGFAALALRSSLAFAQSSGEGSFIPQPPEKVIVTAPRTVRDAVLRDFVKSFGKSSEPVGNIARWRVGICPAIRGLPPDYNKLIIARIREIAAQVGAPVGREGCRFNTDIVFTPKPQALMDEVREKHEVLLGYHDTAEATRMATVSRPIQAWYATETEDMDGYRQIDAKQNNRGVSISNIPSCRAFCSAFLPFAREERVDFSRFGDRLRSELFHVIVTVDMTKIAGIQLGALADHVAVMALAPARLPDGCLEPPSIMNQTAGGCPADKRPNTATPYDFAYLQALYRVDSSLSLSEQQSAIQYRMRKALDAGG
jgi:hypothetical protein